MALFAALVALVVLPAVLSLLGPRVNAGAPAFLRRRADRDARAMQEGFWYRLSRFVMRRPGPVAAGSAALLIALGIPFLQIKFTSVDPQVLPESASARQVDNSLRANFPPFHDTPIQVVVDGGGERAATKVQSELHDMQGVAAVEPARRLNGGVTIVDAVSTSPFIAQRSKDAVTRIRDLPDPAGSTVLVTGASAHFVDFQSSLEQHLPIALAIVVIATLVILFLMTGSVVLPVKSLLMNVLNLLRRVRDPRPHLPGRQLRGPARLLRPGGARADDADPDLCRRLRPLDRLRRLPTVANQGGPRRRRLGLRECGDRPRAHRTYRHRGCSAVRDRDRRLRDVADHLHQGERGRDRTCGTDRRLNHPCAAGPLADGAPRQVELVGAPPAAAPARPSRARGGLSGRATCGRRARDRA